MRERVNESSFTHLLGERSEKSQLRDHLFLSWTVTAFTMMTVCVFSVVVSTSVFSSFSLPHFHLLLLPLPFSDVLTFLHFPVSNSQQLTIGEREKARIETMVVMEGCLVAFEEFFPSLSWSPVNFSLSLRPSRREEIVISSPSQVFTLFERNLLIGFWGYRGREKMLSEKMRQTPLMMIWKMGKGRRSSFLSVADESWRCVMFITRSHRGKSVLSRHGRVRERSCQEWALTSSSTLSLQLSDRSSSFRYLFVMSPFNCSVCPVVVEMLPFH